MVGGATPSSTAFTEITASTDPAAPSRWPSIDLVELLEDQDPGPLPHDEAVAFQVEGTARQLGLDLARRHRARSAEGSQRQRRDARFASTGDHGRRVATPDGLEGLTDRVRP